MRRLLLLFMLCATSAQAQDFLSGLIHFQGQGKRQADLLGRNQRGWVSLRKTNETAIIEFPASQIEFISFELALESSNLANWTRKREYEKVAEHLEPRVIPCLPYADVPNNMMEHLPPLMQSLYFSEQYDHLVTVANQIAHHVPPGVISEEAQIMRSAALLKTGRIDEARRLFSKVKPVERGDLLSSPYWFVKARLHMLGQEFEDSHDTFSKIITYNANDREWLPPSLYWTVAMYINQDEQVIAEQIIKELDTSFPLRDWATRSAQFLNISDCIDASDNGYDGRYRWYPTLGLRGATSTSKTAVAFDGRIQYVELGSALPFIGGRGQEFTISLWYLTGKHGSLFTRGDPDSEHPDDRGIDIRSDLVRIRGFEPASMRTLGFNIKQSGWKHLAVVRGINPPEIRVYENGQRTHTVPYSAGYNFSNPEAELLLAAKTRPRDPGIRFSLYRGALDDLQVFDAALDDSQIIHLQKNPGQSGRFATRRLEIDFANDGTEYAKTHPLRGLKGPLALASLNEAYKKHAVTAFGVEFGAPNVEILDQGDPNHRLKVDGDERLGERLFWLNRTESSLPFRHAGISRIETGETTGHITLAAFAEYIPDSHTIADLQEVGRTTAILTPANLGIVSLDVKTTEPARSLCLYRSDASGNPVVDNNLPAVTLDALYFEVARNPAAYFTFDEKPKPKRTPAKKPPPPSEEEK